MAYNWKIRKMAWLLAGAVTLTGIPVTADAAWEQETAKIAAFDFNAEAADGYYAGENAKAKINGDCQQKERMEGDSALYLNGTDSWLTVTAADGSSLLKGKNEITISYDAKPEKSEKSWSFFAAPDGNDQTYKYENYLGILHTSTGLTVERYNNNGERPGNNLTAAVSGQWTHVDVTVSEAATKLYVDGELLQESESTYELSEILGADGGVLQIGKGSWDGGEYYQGLIDNYEIYDGVLSETEIAEKYQAAKEEREFLEAYEAVTILNMDDVRGNLPLVREGKNGVSISWTSSDPSVVTDSAEADSLYDGGVVTRPAAGSEPVKVELTAVITLGGTSKTKKFEVTVQPLETEPDDDYTGGYLWVNFGVEDGYEKIFFGYSEDGLSWEKLNKVGGVSRSVLQNDAKDSDLGVRDPHLIRSAEGDRYWILGTDLHAEGSGSGGSGWNQQSASQNIIVWESTDLVNWSEPRLVYAGLDTAGCVWAPEAIYDDTTGDYVVYWSARDYAKNDTEEDALRVYVCRTRDFQTFSEPKVWLSEDVDSLEVNIIDSTIIEDDGKFYRFSTSDWNTVIDVSDILDTEDVLDVRKDAAKSTPNGSWTRLVTRSGSSAAGFDSREGHTVYQLPDGRWCVMGDNSGYQAFVTDSLASGKFEKVSAEFVDGSFRHGTVVRLSETEEAKLLEAYGDTEEKEAQEPVLTYDFEQDLGKTTILDTATGNILKNNGKLYGNAKVVYDEERQSQVLTLDGADGSYAEISQGFFDARDTMTISMDVKSELSSGNFFTFAVGKDSTYYDFFRVVGTQVRNAVTTGSYHTEAELLATGVSTGEWQRVVFVIEGTTRKLYLNGRLAAEHKNTGVSTSDLGTALLSYLGKSFYGDDIYFKGSYDNIKVYNRALKQEEILADMAEEVSLLCDVTVGTVPANPSATMGTDTHTAVTTDIDRKNGEISSYVRKGTDKTAVPVTLDLLTEDVEATVNGEAFTNGSMLDLSRDAELTISFLDKTETYLLKTPKTAWNPVLPGQYADPDIDYFNGKYWIYPTTDGYSGWGGTQFHVWSSENLIDWEDEGVILDVADKNPGTNENGVQIAASKWSDGNAWAPSIEEKNGKYYFYYCGNVNSSYTSSCGSGKAIGVAVADSPKGPFVAQEMPIVYPKMLSDANIGFSGQVIDPSIFTDDDGTSYLFFGNGDNGAAFAQLNEDMLTIKAGTLKRIYGMKDFRESVIVTKRNGIYHFTWSCDDTGSPNYHVNYGTAEKLDGNVTYKYTLLEKDESGDMLGTAHQSILYMQDTDTCYIAYHRFYTPLGIYTDGLGYHRETCIEELTFDEETGLMNPLVPTMEGAAGKKVLEAEKEKLDEIAGKLTLEELAPGGILEGTEKLSLPDSLEEALISWKSDNTAVIGDDGSIILPQEDTEVTLTATLISGEITVTKTFILLVKAKEAETEKPTPETEEISKEPQQVTLNVKAKITVGKKEKVQLKATVLPQGVFQKVTWSSSKPSVVSVSATGKISAKKTGKAVITAMAENGKSVSCQVTVKNAPKKITLNKKEKVLKKGKIFKIKAKLPKKTASYRLTYKSSKKAVATVSADGVVIAKKKGTAVITVQTYNKKKAKIRIVVK